MAFGPKSEIAVHACYEQGGSSGAKSETIVKIGEVIDRRPMPYFPNFGAPLAFDKDGKLHQAVVGTVSGGRQEVRSLLYLSKPPGGEWSQEIVDSTAGHGAWGPIPNAHMSGDISLCLDPDDSPVILANASRTSSEHLAVYFRQSGEWNKHEIDLRPVAASLGLDSIEAGWGQLLFDNYVEDKEHKHPVHISNFSDRGGISGVLYLALDDQWNVMEQRYIPAHKLFGMAIDSNGTVYLAVR